MKWLLFVGVWVVGCADPAPPSVSGEGADRPPVVSQGSGGSGGFGGTDGGTDAGIDGGDAKGACDNESDIDAIESAGRLRDVARNCGLINCANFVGNSSGYESCVSGCVAFSAPTLSSECSACYASAERCSHDWFCRGPCQNDTCSTTCLECLNGADCLLDFEECRGLPGDGCAGTP